MGLLWLERWGLSDAALKAAAAALEMGSDRARHV
jgi:hypothetical protein